jgi:histidyl-tRNA synthetase
VFLSGPVFRYDRPQKGRYRQFHQLDLEVLGSAEPMADAEVIACGWDIIKSLGIADYVVLELNTLGDQESRQDYRGALVGYFSKHRDQLSADSQMRLERNPLRILDSKDERDRAIVADAPTIHGFLTGPAAQFYARLRTCLDRFGVPYRENPRIVRGLDYYGHTAFEFITQKLGAQDAVGGGGRYDGLVEEMGGPSVPCVGWALGIDRLALLLQDAPRSPKAVAVVPIGEAAEAAAFGILQTLRRTGIRAEMAYRGNLRRRMERANRIGARAAVIIGDDDIARGVAQVKDLATGEQEAVTLAEIAARLR